MPRLEIPDGVMALLNQDAPVAIGVSGGKDSVACALITAAYLNDLQHQGEKILIHSDLGMVEWADSYPSCERLSFHLLEKYNAWALHTTRRQAGGMMERWETRWESSRRRYENLECVKVILPWSTPSMRFCTSELKSAPIASYLKKQFGKRPIISATGIRAEESANRAKMPASKPNPRLPPGSLDWNPILRWRLDDVWKIMADSNILRHEAYRVFGSSRVSCAFCIMSAGEDLQAALRDPRNHELYFRMVKLELLSGFAFQGGKWLADLKPNGYQNLHQATEKAKQLAAERIRFERDIPKHMEFTKGWPEAMPNVMEAHIIAGVRRGINDLYGWNCKYLDHAEVLDRYAELIRLKEEKQK